MWIVLHEATWRRELEAENKYKVQEEQEGHVAGGEWEMRRGGDGS